MKMSNNVTVQDFQRKYQSIIQTKAILADPQNLWGDLGRGSGKTTNIMGPRFVRVTHSLARSIVSLAGPSYAFVLETIVPGILEHMNTYYKRGIHFEYGKEPPKHFKRPIREVTDWKHTISTAWGTVAKFTGVDRPNTSGVGDNRAHIFADEMLRINETNYTERLMPSQRGDRSIFGNSPYFAGVTCFSSTPNFENDHDWWLSQAENMDEGLMEEIMYVAYRVSVALAQVEVWRKEKAAVQGDDAIKLALKFDDKIEKHLRFAAKWEARLNEKRKGATMFLKGSSFTNLVILGLDYFKNQYKGSRHNLDKFKLSILGIRPKTVKDLFFSRLDSRHFYEDSYQYNTIDLHAVDGSYVKTSRDLKYCDTNKPILMGLDPGNFMSVVFGQEKDRTLRVFKNMYCIIPDEHHEMAVKISEFFAHHNRKTIYLHYDRAGNQRKEKYRNNPKGDTDAKILKNELEAFGWTVHLMSQDQRTIFYWQHYLLFSKIMAEREERVPKLRICQYECEELISSMWMSPRKRGEDNNIILDKSSERKLDYVDQAWYSTQIPSALMYLIFGLYEKFLPDGKPDTVDYEGI
jgi:hypothetical protein